MPASLSLGVPTTRLAPSPTGALHLGNVRTFLITWALARRFGWRIVLRIEDLDTPRVKSQTIALTEDLLTWLGLSWEGEVVLQSRMRDAHVLAMQQLASRSCVFPSPKLRSEGLATEAPQSAPNEGAHEMRFGPELRPPTRPSEFTDDAPTWRFATPNETIEFTDLFAGPQRVCPASTVGDFVVWSKREGSPLGQAAYQLAVVVDDAAAGVTHVVRGNDLIDSTGRQLLLLRELGLPAPAYVHVPLVRGSDGKRLAKRHGDTRLDAYRARGVRAERVVGLMAAWCGVLPREQPQEMALAEFVERFSLATLSQEDVVYGPQDEAWLLGESQRSGGTR